MPESYAGGGDQLAITVPEHSQVVAKNRVTCPQLILCWRSHLNLRDIKAGRFWDGVDAHLPLYKQPRGPGKIVGWSEFGENCLEIVTYLRWSGDIIQILIDCLGVSEKEGCRLEIEPRYCSTPEESSPSGTSGTDSPSAGVEEVSFPNPIWGEWQVWKKLSTRWSSDGSSSSPRAGMVFLLLLFWGKTGQKLSLNNTPFWCTSFHVIWQERMLEVIFPNLIIMPLYNLWSRWRGLLPGGWGREYVYGNIILSQLIPSSLLHCNLADSQLHWSTPLSVFSFPINLVL